MRILVTGGHGFIGSHVLQQLVADGHDVTCFDLASPSPVAKPVADAVTQVRGDVTDPVEVYDTVARHAPDRIIHLASLLGRESQADPRRAVTVNLTGTITVLEAADSLDVDRVVAASSASAYGNVPADVERLKESVTRHPTNVYGLTKFAVERIGATYRAQRDLSFAAIQPVHGLGPDRQRGNVEGAAIIKAAVSGHPITVPRIEYPVETIYVGDEARAFVMAALADEVPHDTYLIGTGEMVTLTEMVELVRDHVPDAEVSFTEDRGQSELLRRPPSDPARIRADLGWTPTTTVDEAVRIYIEWLQDHPGKWTFDPADVPWT